jgi:hypothetical protein
MKIKEVVQQIIKLKKRYNLVERDATPTKEREWYTWALANGHCEFVERNGIVLGFLEWVRLNYVPKNKYDIHNMDENGDIAFAGNAIATEPGILNMLKRSAMNKNKDCVILCWHDKKTNRIFKRRFA